MKDFNKIVNNLCKKRWKLFFKEDIFELIDPEKKIKYISVLTRTISKLKAQGIIIWVKAWVYVIPCEGDLHLNKIDLLDKYYMPLLKKIIIKEVWSYYYISGQKSLEIHMKNYEIPEKLFIVNRNINKRIKIGTKEIIFKTISWKINNWKTKKINLFSQLSKYSVLKKIENTELKISWLELALLETTLITDSNIWFDIGLINKVMNKYKWVLSREVFYDIWKYKYIMSFNRLKELAKDIDEDLYKCFLDVIKVNGCLFIWEGVRGI